MEPAIKIVGVQFLRPLVCIYSNTLPWARLKGFSSFFIFYVYLLKISGGIESLENLEYAF